MALRQCTPCRQAFRHSSGKEVGGVGKGFGRGLGGSWERVGRGLAGWLVGWAGWLGETFSKKVAKSDGVFVKNEKVANITMCF